MTERPTPLILAVAALLILLTASFAFAANDPGHDTLYVLRVGDTNVTGTINLTGNVTASFIRAATLLYGDQIDIRANGSILTPSSRPAIQADANELYLDSITNLRLNTRAGTTSVVQIGPTTGSGITLNVSGTIRQQNVAVCLANGTNCINGNNTGNVSSVTAGSGLANSGTASDPVLDVNAGAGIEIDSDTLRIAAAAAGNGLAGGAGSALDVQVDDGLVISGDKLIVNNASVCRTDGTGCPSSATSGSGWVNTSTLVRLASNATNVSIGNTTGNVPNLFVDNRNGRIGIGTSSPTLPLTVNGASNFTGDLILSGNLGMDGISVITSTRSAYLLDLDIGGAQALIDSSGNGVFQSLDVGSSAATIDGTGLGTFARLDIASYGTVVTSGGVGTFAAGTTVAGNNVCLIDGTNCPSAGNGNSGWLNTSTLVRLASNATNVSIGNTTGNLPAIYVDSAIGRVGFGTYRPNALLDVNGSINVSGTGNLNVQGGVLSLAGTTRIANNGVGTFATGTTVNSLNICLADGTNCPVATGSGWLNTTNQVYLANNATNVSVGSLSSIPTFFVDNTNGRVGVGASTPTAKLTVTGLINSYALIVSGTGSSATANQQGSNISIMGGTGSNPDAGAGGPGGDVLLGSGAGGAAGTGSSAGGRGGLLNLTAGDGASGFGSGANGTGGHIYLTPGLGAGNAADGTVIVPRGQVGIGVSAPGARLDINASGSDDAYALRVRASDGSAQTSIMLAAGNAADDLDVPGGSVLIRGGQGSNTSTDGRNGGNITIAAGPAGRAFGIGTGGVGGALNLSAGDGGDGNAAGMGGAVYIGGGNSNDGGDGGVGGTLYLRAGDGGSGAGRGGNITLTPGYGKGTGYVYITRYGLIVNGTTQVNGTTNLDGNLTVTRGGIGIGAETDRLFSTSGANFSSTSSATHGFIVGHTIYGNQSFQSGLLLSPDFQLPGNVGVLTGVFLDFQVVNNNKNITRIEVIRLAPSFPASYNGSVSVLEGIKLLAPVRSNGSITTYRGINIEDFQGADNVRGIVSSIDINASLTEKHNLYISGTADNYLAGAVGIGTSAPTRSLDVNGTVSISTDSSAADSGNPIALSIDGNETWYFTIPRCGGCYSPGAGIGDLVLRAGSARRALRITTTGGANEDFTILNTSFVGINDSTPAANLEITSVLRLTPTDSPFACAVTNNGSMYYDHSLREPCYCNGTAWKQFDSATTC